MVRQHLLRSDQLRRHQDLSLVVNRNIAGKCSFASPVPVPGIRRTIRLIRTSLTPHRVVTPVKTGRIVLYDNGVRIWGTEPAQHQHQRRRRHRRQHQHRLRLQPNSNSDTNSNTNSDSNSDTNSNANPTPTPTPTPPPGGCSVAYRIIDQWPGAFKGDVTIFNSGPAINGWTLTWTFPTTAQRITQLWNGSVVQTGANVSVTNLSYNNIIASGGNVNFDSSLIGAAPTRYRLPSGSMVHLALCDDEELRGWDHHQSQPRSTGQSVKRRRFRCDLTKDCTPRA